jgi:hypothetical protein
MGTFLTAIRAVELDVFDTSLRKMCSGGEKLFETDDASDPAELFAFAVSG